ncbi:MAG: hypothetical protein MJE66_04785, partial [Proteobacteria bacterium]|nr:hypothetical protein [Pseudomonadota bacterium]
WRDIAVQVGPPRERDGERPRLELAPEGIPEELGAVRAEPFAATGGGYGEDAERYSHRLISRRLLHVYNSSGRDLKALRARGTTNPAFMHPDDLTDLGLADGDLVELRSPHGRIPAVVEATDELARGVVSMAHAWGAGPEDDAKVREIGAPTNRLVDDESDFDPITGMARQSAIPINVLPVGEPAPPRRAM